MSAWVAVALLVGLPLAGAAAGLCLAELAGRRRRWRWGLGGLAAATAGLALAGLAIPGFAIDVRSAIVPAMSGDPVPVGIVQWTQDLARHVLPGWAAGLIGWWRGLLDLEAWRSLGFVLVPLAIVIVPLFLWQITKMHIDD